MNEGKLLLVCLSSISSLAPRNSLTIHPTSSWTSNEMTESPEVETPPEVETSQDDKNDPKKKDNDETDDEGLALRYDVILYGTGLVQSIVASALARAGKTVLHCDASDYYGSYDAVWALPFVNSSDGLMTTIQQSSSQDQEPLPEDAIPLLPQGEASALKILSRREQPDPESYSIATPGSLVWTVYGLARMDSVEMINGGTSVQLTLSLTSCKPLSKDNPNDEDKFPKLCLSIPVRDLSLDNPSDPSREELQRAVDLYHKTKRQEEQSGTTVQSKTAGVESLQSHNERVDEEILQQRGRSFALDVSPGLLFAFGPAVQGLLQSSVAEYVEFKSLEKLLYYGDSNKGRDKTPSLLPVPCSKNDVFSSSLLSPMEKRRIMKFLQLALDYSLLLAEEEEQEALRKKEQNENVNDSTNNNQETATSSSDEAVTSWNERHLNQGRSLARPQNKAVNTEDMTILQECMQSKDENGADAYTFERYLSEKQKLSPSLISLVRFALSLEPVHVTDISKSGGTPSSSSLRDGMLRLCRHMQALGRFGSTGFLVPLYGSGELSQAFCRSAAVYGATYLLRRSLSGVAVEKQSSGETIVSGAILCPPTDVEGAAITTDATTKRSKRVACKHVVVPEGALTNQSSPTKKRVLRRVSIIRGKPLVKSADEQQRMAIIVPPNATTKNAYTIHGLLLDETVNVAPHLSVKEPRTGCSVLQLSTVVEGDNGEGDAVLKGAVDKILDEQVNERDCEEIFHLSFSIPFLENLPGDATAQNPHGLHVIHRSSPAMVLDTAFEQAKEIFAKICPNKEFLVLAQEIDTMVKERFGDRADEDDDEKRVLESAMDMIGDKEASPPEEEKEVKDEDPLKTDAEITSN